MKVNQNFPGQRKTYIYLGCDEFRQNQLICELSFISSRPAKFLNLYGFTQLIMKVNFGLKKLLYSKKIDWCFSN
jgi:hypothetical protein